MKKILLTGASGFLGSRFYTKYKDDYKFYLYDKKINGDLSKIKTFPKVDVVLHLAAFNSTKDFYAKPNQVIKDNILPTINLVDFYKNKKNKPIFFFAGTPESASGSVEKLNYKIPTDEKVPFFVPDLDNKRWSYALSKTLSEQIVSFSGLNYIIFRPHNVYGPRQKNHFIPEFISRAKNKKSVNLYGHKNKRCWLYIDDFCEALNSILKGKKFKNQRINIGSNYEASTYKVAKIILKYLNPKIKTKINKKSAPDGSVNRRVPDISKMRKLYKWKPTTNIYEGIKKTINER